MIEKKSKYRADKDCPVMQLLWKALSICLSRPTIVRSKYVSSIAIVSSIVKRCSKAFFLVFLTFPYKATIVESSQPLSDQNMS